MNGMSRPLRPPSEERAQPEPDKTAFGDVVRKAFGRPERRDLPDPQRGARVRTSVLESARQLRSAHARKARDIGTDLRHLTQGWTPPDAPPAPVHAQPARRSGGGYLFGVVAGLGILFGVLALMAGSTSYGSGGDYEGDWSLEPTVQAERPGFVGEPSVPILPVSKRPYLQDLDARGLIEWDGLVSSDTVLTTSETLTALEFQDRVGLTQVRFHLTEFDAEVIFTYLQPLDPAGATDELLRQVADLQSGTVATTDTFTLTRQLNADGGFTIWVVPRR